MKICVCLDAFTADLPLERALEASAAADGIEFWDWRTRDVPALGSWARANKVPVVAFSANTFGEPLVDVDARPRAIAHLARSLKVAQDLGTRVLVTHVGYTQPDRPKAAQWEAAVRGLHQAGELAAAAGVTLAVEPLNSVLDHPGYFLDTLPEALRMIEEVGLPSVRLLLDVYHMQMMHDDLHARLPEAVRVTAHVHVADVPGRAQPGTGAIPWPAVMAALREHGYRGWVGLECWPRGEPDHALRESLHALAVAPLGGRTS